MPRVGRRRATIVVLMLAGLTILTTAPAQAVRPIYREIGDWLLACDNARDCVARQAPAADAAEDYDPDLGSRYSAKPALPACSRCE